MQKMILALLLFLGFQSTNAQDCNTAKLSEGFEIIFDQSMLKSGEYSQLATVLRNPKTSTEVNNTSLIECSGYMPNRAKIQSIKIVDVQGLPKGLTWFCDTDDCVWEGGETGCFFMEGTVEEAGNYPIQVEIEGVGSLFGISKSYQCFLKEELVIRVE